MMSVAGSGTVNLKNETLNLSLDPSTKGGVAGYNLSIGELAQPFKLGGTLANPSLVLDKQKTAASIGKAIGKDGLKGLLRKESSETASADSEVDLCASALQAAKTGVKQAVKPGISPDAAAGDEKQQPVTTEKLIEDAIKDPKKALKNLFGK
ncbi:MAG: hypothetical protein GX846_08725 [Deltaproteobacteria bacterium]|nr:hypothetical protein [Deltaproteobacteria bacterium]